MLLVQRRLRVAAVLVLTIAAPVVFFSVVPTNGLSALFFDRYMLPALPSFLILVAIACTTLARLAWRLRLVAVVVLVAALMSVGLRIVLARQSQLARLGLGQVTAAVRGESRDAVLFGSTGFTLPGGYLGYFTFGRPPNLADHYLSLRIPSLPFVNDDACAPVVDFIAKGGPPRYGLWVFWAVQRDDQQKAEAAFRRMPRDRRDRAVPAFPDRALDRALSPRQTRQARPRAPRVWLKAVPFNQRATLLIDADSTALLHPRQCRAVGVLGDPDIVPNYPLPASP